jgi:glucosyl-3-phosphoglycerate phosphatase
MSMCAAPPRGNRFVLLRHGQSRPNVAGLIVSRPSAGVEAKNGLTAAGREQAVTASGDLRAMLAPGERVLVLSSDFSRAWETASIVADLIPGSELRQDVRLRERFFGLYEGQSSSRYEDVWEQDAGLGTRRGTEWHLGSKGVESVYCVRARMSQVVREVNSLHSCRLVLLVSHGDALQILQTLASDLPAFRHRELGHLENGEVRPLLLEPTWCRILQ